MASILLSIKPEYAYRILDGSKRYEFRRSLAQGDIRRIIIYATAPEKHVVGEVEVIGTLSMKKTPLWENTKHAAGISRSKFREYFTDCSNANAYVLGKTIKYQQPKDLDEYGVRQAPQSFVYIE